MGRTIVAGSVAGLVAGLIFDTLMRVVATEGRRVPISMIRFATRAVHTQSLAAGFLAYPVYGLLLGALFGWLIGSRALEVVSGLALGGLYGFAWWMLTGLVLIPADLGAVPFSGAAVALMLPSAVPLLAGHVVYGMVLGAVFALLTRGPGRGAGAPIEESPGTA